MREIVAVCRSEKKSIGRVSSVLDRYFWRIGDRTWRGRASNACLDRVSRELRKIAKRNTAVVIHEIRSSSESRIPLVRIGNRSSFSEEGVVPVATHPADFRRSDAGSERRNSALGVLGVAALFHDLGKATVLFQTKFRTALKSPRPIKDPVRHEAISAAVWDVIFGALGDADLIGRLETLSSSDIDAAVLSSAETMFKLSHDQALPFRFTSKPGSIAFAVGMLILTHHRLPDGSDNHLTCKTNMHLTPDREREKVLQVRDLHTAAGTPYWHEDWFLRRLKRDAGRLRPNPSVGSLDIALRASLMFADHLGSAEKNVSGECPEHLANTKDGNPADSLSRHVQRVYQACRGSFGMLSDYKDRYPALSEADMPVDLVHPPVTSDKRFRWQKNASSAARRLAAERPGGFFGCILSGTGTGKTRGAPTILAAAAFADSVPQRRYFRMTLGVGLRTLATQTGAEYVRDLNLTRQNVSVLVGKPPIEFKDGSQDTDSSGSESLIDIPEWLQVQQAQGSVPDEGSAAEDEWIRGLSLDTERELPAFLERVLKHAGTRSDAFRRLVSPPVLAATIDHLMAVASPINSRYLPQTVRLMTSDLILDEIDQYDPEDLAAVGRLAYQTGAAGRRMIVMSATLTKGVASTLHSAYLRGWNEYALFAGMPVEVGVLCTSDCESSCFTNVDGSSFPDVYDRCRNEILASLQTSIPLRRGRVLPHVTNWNSLVEQIDRGCSELHDTNHEMLDGYRVSIGFVRLTRISHTAALAAQLPAEETNGRLRLKVCLHSNFPRLHRAWIENELRKALTRKRNPNSGLTDLCRRFGVFEKASEAGVQDIEIVVVCSPVIETGNDLDFDWAILDPISVRSVVQSAGRVRRHRPPMPGTSTNILILGQSVVALQDGSLSRPGVESPVAGETVVNRLSLAEFEGRKTIDLIGEHNLAVVNASIMLDDKIDPPLKKAEVEMLDRMVCGSRAPLSTYCMEPVSRLNRRMTRSRRFRRKTSQEVVFAPLYEDGLPLRWYVNSVPEARESVFYAATETELDVSAAHFPGVLFSSLVVAHQSDEFVNGRIARNLEVSVAVYGDQRHALRFAYSVSLGITRGSSKDVFEPFGKGVTDQ